MEEGNCRMFIQSISVEGDKVILTKRRRNFAVSTNYEDGLYMVACIELLNDLLEQNILDEGLSLNKALFPEVNIDEYNNIGEFVNKTIQCVKLINSKNVNYSLQEHNFRHTLEDFKKSKTLVNKVTLFSSDYELEQMQTSNVLFDNKLTYSDMLDLMKHIDLLIETEDGLLDIIIFKGPLDKYDFVEYLIDWLEYLGSVGNINNLLHINEFVKGVFAHYKITPEQDYINYKSVVDSIKKLGKRYKEEIEISRNKRGGN